MGHYRGHYHLTVPEGRKLGSGRAEGFGFRVSRKIAVRTLARAAAT